MSYLIRRALAKPRRILDEMCRLYGKFASYLRRVLCKTRLIFPRINGPNVPSVQIIENLAVTQKMDRKIIINKERFRLFIVYTGIRKPVGSRFE